MFPKLQGEPKHRGRQSTTAKKAGTRYGTCHGYRPSAKMSTRIHTWKMQLALCRAQTTDVDTNEKARIVEDGDDSAEMMGLVWMTTTKVMMT